MTFTEHFHFEDILDHCTQKLIRLRLLVNIKWGPNPTTILHIYKQCIRPTFEYGTVITITASDTVINKLQRFQNSFIRTAQASYDKGPDYFLLKTEIFPISVFLLLFSMKFHTELENDQPDSFQ